MSPPPPLPRLPYYLLATMTLASLGGPFAIVGILWGGPRSGWPPDRPIEWVVIALVFGLVIALFIACVGIRLWYRPPQA